MWKSLKELSRQNCLSYRTVQRYLKDMRENPDFKKGVDYKDTVRKVLINEGSFNRYMEGRRCGV